MELTKWASGKKHYDHGKKKKKDIIQYKSSKTVFFKKYVLIDFSFTG